MLATGLGLIAALLWSVHDLMARRLSPGAALLPMVLVVLASGAAALAVPAFFLGKGQAFPAAALLPSVLGGLGFALAIGALYRAFSLAPARIVSPVIGAYPVLSLLIAAAQGRAVSLWASAAVLAVVGGIVVVSWAEKPAPGVRAPRLAVLWSALSAAGFAATFALAQEAARLGPDLSVIVISRLVATTAILALVLLRGGALLPPRGARRILCAMGVFDAAALGLVTAAGSLPFAEFATVTSSLFGVGTILLAAVFLHERLTRAQWLGVAVVFAGVAALSAQG